MPSGPRRTRGGVRTVPLLIVLGAVAIYTWYFTKRSLDIHHALGTSTLRLGALRPGHVAAVEVQGAVQHVDGPQPVRRPHVVHPAPPGAVLLAVPRCRASCSSPSRWPSAPARSRCSCTGGERLGSEWFAIVGAATYLLHPAVGWTNLENFHPDAFLGVFVGFAIYAALESQMAAVRRVRRAVAAREGGRVARDRARSGSGWRSSATGASAC